MRITKASNGWRGAAAAGLTALALAGCGTAATATSSPPSAKPGGIIATIIQPTTAAQAATQLGATGYTDCGSAPGGGVITSGIAQYKGKQIGIDAFATAQIRDAWLKTVASFGVVAWLEGSTWVAYLATGSGCKAI
jgi:hypothetical protein